MQISKWHARSEDTKSAPEGKRRNKRRAQRSSETHWITVDGDLFQRLEAMAGERKTSVDRLLDSCIAQLLDRESK